MIFKIPRRQAKGKKKQNTRHHKMYKCSTNDLEKKKKGIFGRYISCILQITEKNLTMKIALIYLDYSLDSIDF